MERLIDCLKKLRLKLERLAKESLKETQTRTIIVGPILEALGWDIHDLDIVQEEYPTIDGKSVDYALKVNEKVVILVEAKPLGDPLTDVKAITQVVGYAANGGIEWCILTNGVLWQVYRSSEKCPAPEKLLFEATYNPKIVKDEDLTAEAEKFWKFSRDSMAEERLDQEGERVFFDGKVKKALDGIMQNPPLPLINIIKKDMGDTSSSSQRLKDSLYRIWMSEEKPIESTKEKPKEKKRGKGEYQEAMHLEGKPQKVLELYRALESYCIHSLGVDVTKVIKRTSINFKVNKHLFCCIVVVKQALKIYLKLNYREIENPPSFSRDVSNVGHWGGGDFELVVNDASQLDQAFQLIKKAAYYR